VLAHSAAGLLVFRELTVRIVCHTSFCSVGGQDSASIRSGQMVKHSAPRMTSRQGELCCRELKHQVMVVHACDTPLEKGQCSKTC
jgi:hypothetical protein